MDNTEILSADYAKAVKLNQHIKAHAQIAQESLYEVCKGLKEMRDDKLYKELNYQNFEEYCEKEVGIKRHMAYKYANIAEIENVELIQHFGVTKLSLLAKLDEPQREEIIQNVNVESTTVRELKAKIAELEPKVSNLTAANQMYQNENQKLKVQVRERDEEIQAAKMMYDELSDEKDELFIENSNLADQLDELRSQGEPVVEAVYSDNSEEVKRLTRRTEELEAELQTTKAEHIKELAQVRAENRRGDVQKIPDYTDSYRILIQNTKSAVGSLKRFMQEHPELAGSGCDFFHQVFLTLANMESKLNKG